MEKDIERISNNILAYACMTLAIVTIIAIIIDAFVQKRFAYWHIFTAAMFWILGRSMYIPKQDIHQRAEDRKF